MLYLYPACLYGAVPNQKQGLLYVLRHVIIWTAEKYGEAVEITKDWRFTDWHKTKIRIQEEK